MIKENSERLKQFTTSIVNDIKANELWFLEYGSVIDTCINLINDRTSKPREISDE